MEILIPRDKKIRTQLDKRESHKDWPHKYKNGRKIRGIGTYKELMAMFYKSGHYKH